MLNKVAEEQPADKDLSWFLSYNGSLYVVRWPRIICASWKTWQWPRGGSSRSSQRFHGTNDSQNGHCASLLDKEQGAWSGSKERRSGVGRIGEFREDWL